MTTSQSNNGSTITLTEKGKRALENNEMTGDMKAVFEQLVDLGDDISLRSLLHNENANH